MLIRYIFNRILHTIPLIFGLTLISFFILQLAPGNYFTQLKLNPQISEATIAQMEREFGLDKPWYLQYFYWLREILRPLVKHVWGIPYIAPKLNFGHSFVYHVPITTLIKERLFNTFILSLSAMLFTWLIAVPIGIYSAVHQYSWADKIFSVLAFFGMSIPNFFLAFLLLYIASVTGWFPIGGMISGNYDTLSLLSKIWNRFHHLMIPTFVLGTSGMAGLVRLMRGNMLDDLRSEYITTARAKGLSERAVIYKHALRNAINPFITLFGYQLSGLFSGAALTEIIVSWPGLGQLMLEAVRSQDLYLVMGDLLMGAFLLIAGNLLSDILLAVSDPRIRHE